MVIKDVFAMSPKPSAIIIAGGYSSRMGELKALLPMGGTTVLNQSINLFRSCGVNDIMVVTGHRAEEVRAVAEKAGVRTTHNPDFAQGMYSSIRAGGYIPSLPTVMDVFCSRWTLPWCDEGR